jgi:murein L,D-transpeptidase YcbB/YkuD
VKKTTLYISAVILICAITSFKKEYTVGELLAKKLGNEIYKEFDSVVYASVFNITADSIAGKLKNYKEIIGFYNDKGHSPRFILAFYQNKNLDTLVSYLQKSKQHGLSPEVFYTSKIKKLLQEVKENRYANVGMSYATLAKTEILVADAFLNYVKYLKYGVVNPNVLFSRYLIPVKQPDSLFAERILQSASLIDTLISVQQNTIQYKALQEAYSATKNDSVRKILSVNMERLRWILPQVGKEYIQINIPDFSLVYFNQKDTVTKMKVCVGKKIDADYDAKLKIFEKTGDYDDKPKNYETPMIFSSVKSFFTNPVWNIPESIASNEIYEMVRRSRYYLERNNIFVYHKNKLIKDPSQIRWSKYSRDKLPFLFVQQAGANNSLGKFKFAFENKSSIFLHDTDNKRAFKFNNRAISHGCIRLERPLELAKLLVGDNNIFEVLREEIGLAPLDSAKLVDYKKKQLVKKADIQLYPKEFKTKMPIPLLITYITAWQKNGKIEYRPDVYGLDKQLWLELEKMRLY